MRYTCQNREWLHQLSLNQLVIIAKEEDTHHLSLFDVVYENVLTRPKHVLGATGDYVTAVGDVCHRCIQVVSRCKFFLERGMAGVCKILAAWKLGDVDILDVADHVCADGHVLAMLERLVGLELVLVDVFARAGARDVVEVGSTVIGHGVVCMVEKV